MLHVPHHILESLEVVEHLESLEQRLASWNHAQALLLQLARVVNRERVALDGARVGGEEHLVILEVFLPVHSVDDK